MAKIHILKSDSNGNYQVVLHAPMPGGNNNYGKAWKDIMERDGIQGATILPEGSGGIGQIIPTEKAEVEAHTTIEIVTTIRNDGMNLTGLNTLGDKRITEYLQSKQLEYNEYGREYTP